MPAGVELLPPQLTFRCVQCGHQPGDEEMGGYFTYPADDLAKAIDDASFHIIHGSVVCDDCAGEHHRNCPETSA
jgi:hypothetical protein